MAVFCGRGTRDGSRVEDEVSGVGDSCERCFLSEGGTYFFFVQVGRAAYTCGGGVQRPPRWLRNFDSSDSTVRF